LLSRAKLRAPKNESSIGWNELTEFREGLLGLTGDEEGPLQRALRDGNLAQADERLGNLKRCFGADGVFVELQRHHLRQEPWFEQQLIRLAEKHRLKLVATNGVLYATSDRRPILDVFTCARHHTDLDHAGRVLEPNSERQLKDAKAMYQLFADLPYAVANSAAIAAGIDFTLENLGYQFPHFPVPPGETMDSHLEAVTWKGARKRYGIITPTVRDQIERELALIHKLGFPGYFSQIAQYNGFSPSTTLPAITMSNPTYNNVGTGLLFSINNNYVIAPTFTKIIGRHTIKAGADLRRLEMAYFQNNNPGGVFNFDNVFTGQSASSPGSTGNPFASFLLGYVSSSTSQTVQIAPPTIQTIYYQGYYAQDTWQANNKLTFTLGLRYEIPGVYVARHGYADTFNPTEINPLVGVPGAFDLVNTPQHPASGVRNEHFDVFSPRLGLAYRLNDATVIRLGWGRFIIPSDLQFLRHRCRPALTSSII